MTFADILDRTASRYPQKVAASYEGRSVVYSEMKKRVDALSSLLLSSGVCRGDRMAVLAPNSHHYLEMYLIAARTGIVLVPLNTRLTAQELLFIVNDCRPTAIVVEEEFRETLESLRDGLGQIRVVLAIGWGFEGAVAYEEVAGKAVGSVPTQGTDDDIMCILYTGGTTGFPKGAALTNGNWIANSANALPALGIKPDDVNLVMTPLFHSAAVWPALLHLYVGATSVMTRRFDVRATFDLLEREKVTFCHPVLAQVVALLDHPEAHSYDLSSLHTVQCTMSLSAPVYERALKVFGNAVVPGYGLTEAGPMVALMPRAEMASWAMIGKAPLEQARRFGSSGLALPNVEARVIDDKGREVPRGEIGEIAVRSDSVMKGYWNRPHATALALRDGWLYTGDMARMDTDGYLYFVDRKSGMIKSGGESVYPKEVEDAIASHSAVLEAAVFGVSEARWGETVRAAVVLRRGMTATEDELIEHCRQRMASYKKPTGIMFVDALPRNPSGKVMKAELLARYVARS
ncbi:MAG: AMP-binding protein [Chloroflexi bacterium]|nr:AMP-binding protein [Chloroflexota bacterium]